MMREAIFAAGCFWGVEDVFSKVPGVLSTTSGYTGGGEDYKKPGYELVSTGRTGHAESVRVIYDPDKVSYETLLDVFWEIHDPTTLNRQGPDVGSQYRSAIFYHDEGQQRAAIASKEKWQQKLGGKPIVTQVAPAGPFYPAEEYHQQYYKKHPDRARGCPIKVPEFLK